MRSRGVMWLSGKEEDGVNRKVAAMQEKHQQQKKEEKEKTNVKSMLGTARPAAIRLSSS